MCWTFLNFCMLVWRPKSDQLVWRAVGSLLPFILHDANGFCTSFQLLSKRVLRVSAKDGTGIRRFQRAQFLPSGSTTVVIPNIGPSHSGRIGPTNNLVGPPDSIYGEGLAEENILKAITCATSACRSALLLSEGGALGISSDQSPFFA